MLFSSRLVSRCVAPGNLSRQKYSLRCSTLRIYHVDKESRQFRRFSAQASICHSRAIKAAHMFNPGESPLIEKTLGQLLSDAAATWPERVAINSVHQNIRMTYAEVLRRADALAAGFKRLGLRKGDRLGIWGPNDLEWSLSSLAASRAGLIATAINPAYQQSELEYSLQKVGVRAVVSPDSFKMQHYPAMLLAAKEKCPTLDHVIIYSADHVTGTRRLVDVEALARRAEVEAIAVEQTEISSLDGCSIQYTSGSTGRAKAAHLSHTSIVNNAWETACRMKLNVDSKICLNVPLFHVFGLVLGQVAVLHCGSTLILQGRSFNPVESLNVMAREKCDLMYGTPTMWANMIAAQERSRIPINNPRCAVTGGSPASPKQLRAMRELLGFETTSSVYGLTEASGVTFQTMLDVDSDYLAENSVGHLAGHVEAIVVDQNGLPVPFGTPGELWTRGYFSMINYWDDEINTRKALTPDGWLKSGDQFMLREDGYGVIIGRFKDLIIRGGENISPKEIEDLLANHPKILEAQIIGVYDEVYGEEICACVQLCDGEKMKSEELRDYCKDKLAYFKIPRYVEFVNEFPKTASGKIQKFRLREQMESKGMILKKQS